MKRKALLASLLTIAICLSIAVGATYALFTSTTDVNISATAANVEFVATIDDASLALYSMGVAQTDTFENGGTAIFDDDSTLKLTNVTPGDKVEFNINVVNKSNVKVQYRVKWSVDGELYSGLVATADDAAIVNDVSDWILLDIPANDDERNTTIAISIELPKTAGNEYQNKTASITLVVEAIQANATDSDKTDIFG